MSPSPHVRLERRGRIGWITIDRPEKANAVTTSMAVELHRLCAEADHDPELRVVVLAAAGDTFSAGSDISSLEEYDSPWAFRSRLDYCDAILNLRKPAIAAVNGAAFGGGLEMAISCDIRIAASTARFAAPEVSLGWIGGGGASQLLPRICGHGDAARILLTGEPVDAETALRIGLVQAVVEPQELIEETASLAERIAANAPIATQAAKAAARAALSVPLTDGMRYEEELVAVCMGSADRAEGIDAFFAKRPPRFQGV